MSFINSSRLDELARRLAESVPESVRAFGRDLEGNFKAVLQSQLSKLDLGHGSAPQRDRSPPHAPVGPGKRRRPAAAITWTWALGSMSVAATIQAPPRT